MVPPVFKRHVEYMLKKNRMLWEALRGTDTWLKVYRGDARRLSSLVEDEVRLILFSPPYVTSYEYVDIHKLSIIWLEQTGALRGLKKEFIGSVSAKPRQDKMPGSPTATGIIEELRAKDPRLARAVHAYFLDMERSFREMDRVLLPGGHVAIVIGNTRLRGVEVRNAEAFAEIFTGMGYRVERVVKRPVPGKNLPTQRDPRTGRFTSSNASLKVYPHEYILILGKPP